MFQNHHGIAQRRDDLLSHDVLMQARQWADISLQEIGEAQHRFKMNPRLTAGQCGSVVPDKIQADHDARERQRAEAKEARERAKRRTMKYKMTRAQAARNAAWYSVLSRNGVHKAPGGRKPKPPHKWPG